MFLLIFASFCLLGGVFSSPIANNYMENLLAYPLKSQIQMHGLDPAPLQHFSTEFKDKTVIGKVKVQANYTQGNITGLSTAVRYSECSGPSYSFGLTKINCTIGFYILGSHYSAKVKYGKLPAVNIKANANITTTTMFVEIVSQPGTNVGRVANMQFQLIGEVQPKFTGLGSTLNKHLKVLESNYITHVKAELFNIITNRFNYALNAAVGQLPMPK